MSQPYFLIHTLSFATGFWWVCHQKGIAASKILLSLLIGTFLGMIAMWGAKFQAHDSLMTHLPLLPLYALLGATTVMWFQAREELTQQMGQDTVYMLTLSFLYFLTPWTGAYREIGIVTAIPCAVVLYLCWKPEKMGPSARVTLMFWAMLASLIIGVQQILLGPDSLYPPKALSLTTGAVGLYWFNTALGASGFVTLALNLFPFIEWVKVKMGSAPTPAAEHQVLSDRMSPKVLLFVTFCHVLPFVLNWKFHFFSYDAVLDFSLVWSPTVSPAIAEFFFGSSDSDSLEWLQEADSASQDAS